MPDRSQFVALQEEIGRLPRSLVGGKAAVLANLAGAAIPVPELFVVTSDALAAFLEHNGIPWGPDAEPDALRKKILSGKMPPSLANTISSATERLAGGGAAKLAVRSSGAEEDTSASSFAGQFDTFLGVDSSDIFESLKACWASYLSDRSIGYRARKRIPLPEEPLFAVIVQRQVLSRAAGVLYTVHPLDGRRRTAYIEANFGTGESVVGGMTEPDGLTISRSTGKVVERRTGKKRWMTRVSPDASGSTTVEVPPSDRTAPVLSDDEAEEIYRVGARIERLQGAAQDIEWSFDDAGLWIVQSRPIPRPAGGRR